MRILSVWLPYRLVDSDQYSIVVELLLHIISGTSSFAIISGDLSPAVYSASKRNEYQREK
jgi:hypothetical protein